MSGNNEAKASLTFHTSEIKLLGNPSRSETAGASVAIQVEEKTTESKKTTFEGIDDDLPF